MRETFTPVLVKCPVEDCDWEYVACLDVDTRGYLYLHLLLEHSWSIKKIESYLNREGI